jgi:hypothetical protein
MDVIVGTKPGWLHQSLTAPSTAALVGSPLDKTNFSTAEQSDSSLPHRLPRGR